MKLSKYWPAFSLTAVVLLSMAGCPQPADVGDVPGPDGNPVGGAGGAGDDDGAAPDGGPGDDSDGDGGDGVGGGDNANDNGADAPGSGGSNTNKAPTAALSRSPAGDVGAGIEITLDASTSSDPDGDALTYTWAQVSGPAGTFSATSGAVVKLTTPYVVQNSAVRVEVTVRDGKGGSATRGLNLNVVVAAQFAGNPQSLLPYRQQLTSDEAYHFLRRTEFGASPTRVTQVVTKQLTTTIDNMIVGRAIPQSVLTVEASFDRYWDRRWLVRLINGPNPFHERMTMFWHDRFATGARIASDYRDRYLPLVHLEMLRENALGNYRRFLEELTLDPLMLLWLDGANSPKDNPNENYAREFWELFTLGRDTLYTEQDIQEGARAFTGITLLRPSNETPRPIFDLQNHDETDKLIFPGRAVAANHDYESVIDLTLAQPEAARYVARNLFVYFVHDHPSDAVVDELADAFVAANFEIAPLVKLILRSQAMFSPEARGNQVASPVEHVIGLARTLESQLYREDALGYIFYHCAEELRYADHELLNPPGVQGWTEGVAWLGDQSVIARATALRWLLRADHGPTRTAEIPYHLLPPVEEWSQRATRGRIVDAMAAVLHLELSPAEREIYIDVLDQNGHRGFDLQTEGEQRAYLGEMIRLMFMDERVITR